MLWFKHFHLALTFLTRLGRARLKSPTELAAALYMYPAVGALLGILLTLTAMLPLSPWVLAWAMTVINLVLTRGLHWDAWADTWDAWGSGAQGERFWAIIKDSRIGAFGVLGLVVGLGLQTTLFTLVIDHQAWALLFWSCIWGRFLCLVLAWSCRQLTRPGLGQGVLEGATPQILIKAGLIAALPIFCLPLAQVGLGLILSLVPLWILQRLGRLQAGINGDFLGSAIIAGEISALLPLSMLIM